MNKKILFIFLLAILLVGNIILGLLLLNNVHVTNQVRQTQQVNLKLLSFTTLFIEKVLMANQAVDFDTRLTLEAMVRNLNDQSVLDQWQKFTNATDQQSASTEAKKLLDILVRKISY